MARPLALAEFNSLKVLNAIYYMLKAGRRQPRTRQRRASAQVASTMADMLEQVVC